LSDQFFTYVITLSQYQNIEFKNDKINVITMFNHLVAVAG